jgi:glycosyltransferase involved in cell wall biosynthesis
LNSRVSVRALLIAEAANPEWVSVPLIGWSLSQALSKITDSHLVTQVRNRRAILDAGLSEGHDFTAIDSEAVGRPLWRLSNFLRGEAGTAWTVATATAALSYYYFERLVWKNFRKRLEAREFDVVHRITPLSPTIPSILARKCESLRVPFIAGPLNGGVPWPPGFGKVRRNEREWLSYLRSAHRLLPGYVGMQRSTSAFIVGSYDTLRQIPVAFRPKCIYLPENAVDPSRFEHVAKAAAFSQPLRACFVGRLVPYKGPDMLLESVASFIRSGRLRLDVIGDGPMKTQLLTLAKTLGAESGITFHGWVQHRMVQDIMRQSQLLIFPSIREFGGGVVLEAMALGIVPIVVDYAGPGELVNADTGFRIPIGTRAEIVSGFHSVIEAILANPAALVSMSSAARQRVLAHFTWDAKARQVLQIYDWVLGRRASKPSFALT